jgi:Arc/MetJ-type ribon-helix-helix transcriptional regulator
MPSRKAKRPSGIRSLLGKAGGAGTQHRPQRADEPEGLETRSVTFTPGALQIVQQLVEQLSRTRRTNRSAVVRACLKFCAQHATAEQLRALIDIEARSGEVEWGRRAREE